MEVNEFKLYWRYIRMHFFEQLQYRGWPIELFMTLIIVITDPLDAILMLDRYGAIGGIQPTNILLVYAIAVCAFGLAELFGRGFDVFPWHVKSGDFDRILLRPRSTIVQVMTLRFHLSRLSRVIGMGVLIGLCIRAQGVALSARGALVLLMALLGGMLLYIGVFIIASAIAFYTVESLDLTYIFTNGSYQVAKLPPQYLPDWLRRLFTYILPMLAVCYYPAQEILTPGSTGILGLLPLPISCAFLAVSLVIWRRGVRHYAGTGS